MRAGFQLSVLVGRTGDSVKNRMPRRGACRIGRLRSLSPYNNCTKKIVKMVKTIENGNRKWEIEARTNIFILHLHQ